MSTLVLTPPEPDITVATETEYAPTDVQLEQRGQLALVLA